MLVLGSRDVEAVLDLDALIDALGLAMADLSGGRTSTPARTFASVAEREALLGDMPSYVPSAGALTSKLVSVFPGNAGTELPVRQAVLVVFDPETGSPSALLDATELTAVRTGACSALSVRLLAREDSAVLAVLGTGTQARAHARAVSRVRQFRTLRVAGRTRSTVEHLARDLSGELALDVQACTSYEEALAGADVVCAATYADEPVVRREWLSPGTHVTSVGYNPKGRELDDPLMSAATLFVESREAALAAEPPNLDLAEPLERDLISVDPAELGEVLEGLRPGRTSAAQLTVYKSVGVAVQDAAAAALVVAVARRRGVGQEVDL
jgi:ornithine cyclodeaminase/alanine dehydrogenase-like protein (mu-crystallin family)